MNTMNKSPIRSNRIEFQSSSTQKHSYWEHEHSNDTSSSTKMNYGTFKDSTLSPYQKNKSLVSSEDIVDKVRQLQLALCQAIQRNQNLQQQVRNYEALLVAAGEQNECLQNKVIQLTRIVKMKNENKMQQRRRKYSI